MYHQLYFQPLLSCFHAHLLASSHIAAEPTLLNSPCVMFSECCVVVHGSWQSSISGCTTSRSPLRSWYNE